MEGDDLEDILNPYKSHTCKMGTHLPNPADISNLKSHFQAYLKCSFKNTNLHVILWNLNPFGFFCRITACFRSISPI